MNLKLYVILIELLLVLFMSSGCKKNILDDIESIDYDSNYIVLKNGTLIDGNGGVPLENSTVVFYNGRITYAGPDKNISVPGKSVVIEMAEKRMLPGIIDCHVHSTFTSVEVPWEVAFCRRIKDWLASGVTTVRDLGMTNKRFLNIPGVLSTIDSNTCSRFIYSGPILSVPGGRPFGAMGLLLNSTDEAESITNNLIVDGAKVIKVYLEGGSTFDTVWSVMPTELLKVIVQTAHNKKIPVSAHVQEANIIPRTLDADVDDIAHPQTDISTPDSIINRMKLKGIYIVSTLSIYQAPSELNMAINNIRRYRDSGIPIALGTDYDGFYFTELGMPFTEMKLLMQAGLSPMEIIIAATRNAAHVCKMEDYLGTLEQGKIADIIVVDGNPLTDMSILRDKLSLVIHNGRIIKY
jgi:imidazolonepropionase-like amidohydrolase